MPANESKSLNRDVVDAVISAAFGLASWFDPGGLVQVLAMLGIAAGILHLARGRGHRSVAWIGIAVSCIGLVLPRVVS